MNNFTYNSPLLEQDYRTVFWDSARMKAEIVGHEKKYDRQLSAFALPDESRKKYASALKKYSVFRSVGTTFKNSKECRILAKNTVDEAHWIPDGQRIPVFDAIDDFTIYPFEAHKLTSLVKLPTEFVYDYSFAIESYLMDRFGKIFAETEDNAFINGNGTNQPTGILNATGGADTGITAEGQTSVSFEEIISLFHSLKPEYRRNAMWLLNDSTATVLLFLKSSSGGFIWNHTDNTILGRPVYICNAMPDMAAGTKPIAFGDFSYYWVIDRLPVMMKVLQEYFIDKGFIGYLAHEYLDGKLIRPEAIKVIQMAAEPDEEAPESNE